MTSSKMDTIGVRAESMAEGEAMHEADGANGGGKECLEVILTWQNPRTSEAPVVLYADHIPVGGSFVVGEGEAHAPVDFELSASELGGASQLSLIAAGQVRSTSAHASAALRSLSLGEEHAMTIGNLIFRVRRVVAARSVARQGLVVERPPLFFVGGVMAFAGVLLGLMALLPPHGAAYSIDGIDQQSRLVQFLTEPAVTQKPDPMEEVVAESGGTEGEAHAGDEGAAGDREAPQADRAYGIEGPADNTDPVMARERAREQAHSAGILGTLTSLQGAFDSPTSPFGADQALGRDAENALGHLTGADIGSAFGFNGLGLKGTGRSGGGPGLGTIGVGHLGTIGRGCRGGDCGDGYRYGSGVALDSGRRPTRVPGPITVGKVEAIGALSKEAIRRVINRHRNEVKFCYERGLQNRPDLEGRLTMRFMIAPSGMVQVASVSGSTLGDAGVESCVLASVRRWTFPQPEGGGGVMVTYPFMMTAPQ